MVKERNLLSLRHPREIKTDIQNPYFRCNKSLFSDFFCKKKGNGHSKGKGMETRKERKWKNLWRHLDFFSWTFSFPADAFLTSDAFL